MDAKYHLIILLIPLPIVWYVLFENGLLSLHLDIYMQYPLSKLVVIVEWTLYSRMKCSIAQSMI